MNPYMIYKLVQAGTSSAECQKQEMGSQVHALDMGLFFNQCQEAFKWVFSL